ncbi:serine hydrolase domain-containing protein [Parabacteroides sp. PF5-9]|uniref:serine hydrolase domain-containing protein n=1 Tax=Parabacteroides sp. PF5-9 TaxID=1742404 RepID=UPI0024771550|nr:serine hydrolase domain-containing protein [Parabacteroides sp. PF5-9]MDH6358021.1 CubicO group peptidase (beta-lactamase class C family) [Parabacteroides sp. PF5-9]
MNYRYFSAIVFVWFSMFFSIQVSTARGIDLDAIDAYLQMRSEKEGLPGFSVAIVDKDEVLFAKGYGRSGHRPITADTPFAIASLSKAFTALSIMQLVEAEQIRLDDDIGLFIPAFEQKGITVRHLLNQTSGFSDRTFPEMRFYEQPDNLDELIDRMKNIELITQPGERFNYHNPNYSVLARLVEIVSGEAFSDYLEKYIFEPLQMDHTYNMAATKDFYTVENLEFQNGYNFLFGRSIQIKEPDWFVQGSAGMLSTANDMARWLMMFMNGGVYDTHRLLSSENIRLMGTPPEGINSSYGMGWSVWDNKNWSHNGILWTAQSEQIILHEEGYGIVILFHSGLNMLVSYNSYMTGIVDIIKGKTPAKSSALLFYMGVGIAVLLVCYILFILRYIIKVKNRGKIWNNKISMVFELIVLIFPLFLLILLPSTVTFLSGRVFHWVRLFWMMPDVIIFLVVAAVLNLCLIGLIFYRYLRPSLYC